MDHIIKRLLLISLISTIAVLAIGQNKINIEEFINRKIESSIPDNFTIKDEKFPWINEYELRTETRDFDLGKQEYSLRLSPNTPKARSAQQAIYRHLASMPNYEQQEIYCEIINESFSDIITLYLVDEFLETYNAWEIIIADKQLVLSKLAGSLDFDYKEILELIELQTEIKFNKEKLNIEKNKLEQLHGIPNISFDFNSIITVENIKAVIGSREIQNSEIAMSSKNQFDLELAKKELELEQAERKQYLDFVQLKYRGPHDNQFEERFSIGLGLKLPNSSNRKLKIKELELEQGNIMNEIKSDQTASIISIADIKHKLNLSILYAEEYTRIVDQENIALDNLIAQIQRESEYDPLLILEIKDRQIETKIQQLSLLDDVYSEYLDYIRESGSACDSEQDILQLISIK